MVEQVGRGESLHEGSTHVAGSPRAILVIENHCLVFTELAAREELPDL